MGPLYFVILIYVLLEQPGDNVEAKFNKVFFFRNEIMWKNIVEPDMPQMKIWRVHIACWIPKTTNTNTACAVLTAFPLHESASMLCYTYIARLVKRVHSLHDPRLLPLCKRDLLSFGILRSV